MSAAPFRFTCLACGVTWLASSPAPTQCTDCDDWITGQRATRPAVTYWQTVAHTLSGAARVTLRNGFHRVERIVAPDTWAVVDGDLTSSIDDALAMAARCDPWSMQ